MKRVLAIFLGAVASVIAMSAAQAALIVNYQPSFGSSENTGATATATFSFSTYGEVGDPVFGASSIDVLLSISLTNTTPTPPTTATIVGFASNIPAPPGPITVKNYDAGTSGFDTFLLDDGFNGNGGNTWGAAFDVCVRTGDANNCSGGNPQSGLAKGESGTLYFGFDTDMTAAEVEAAFLTMFTDAACPSAIRVQQVSGATSGGTSDKICGRLTTDSGGELPEPGVLALLGLGILGFATSRRRRRV